MTSYKVGDIFSKDKITYQIVARAKDSRVPFCEYLLGYNDTTVVDNLESMNTFYKKYGSNLDFQSIILLNPQPKILQFNSTIIRTALFFPLTKERLIQGIFSTYK